MNTFQVISFIYFLINIVFLFIFDYLLFRQMTKKIKNSFEDYNYDGTYAKAALISTIGMGCVSNIIIIPFLLLVVIFSIYHSKMTKDELIKVIIMSTIIFSSCYYYKLHKNEEMVKEIIE